MRKAGCIAAIASGALLWGCGERDRPQDLVIWSTESDPTAVEILNEIGDQLEARYNADVERLEVRIETVSWGGVSERLINASRADDLPDISHVQPFMVSQLYNEGHLLPITELRNELEIEIGTIFPSVRDLQVFDEDAYGIAYAVGTTFWSLRADLTPEGLDPAGVVTWQDYLEFVEAAHDANPGLTVTLPGGSPFFMDQLFGELVANAGGNLFGADGCPLLEEDASVAALQFLADLSATGALDPNWGARGYTDQFQALAEGSVFSVPVTYARASRTVLASYDGEETVDDQMLLWMPQPVLRDSDQSIATIDAEPWVVFSPAASRTGATGETNEALAHEFLRLFYSAGNYGRYTQAVPIHLTPIFEAQAVSADYVIATRGFEDWQERTLEHLGADNTRPIIMTDISERGRNLPFLLDFQRSGILSGAMADVLRGAASADAAATRAQSRAEQLISRFSGFNCEG